MDAGADAIGGAELRHPDEHVDAELLGPGQVELRGKGKHRLGSGGEPRQTVCRCPSRERDGLARAIAMQHGDEDQAGRRRNEGRDQPFLDMVECAVEEPRDGRRLKRGARIRSHGDGLKHARRAGSKGRGADTAARRHGALGERASQRHGGGVPGTRQARCSRLTAGRNADPNVPPSCGDVLLDCSQRAKPALLGCRENRFGRTARKPSTRHGRHRGLRWQGARGAAIVSCEVGRRQ